MRFILGSLLNGALIIGVFMIVGLRMLSAQEFKAEKLGIISDKDGSEIIPSFFMIPVEGISSKIDSTFGLEKVCFHIKHRRPSDLKIELLSPEGTSVWISNRNGESNNYGYLNTCVVQNGFNGPIHSPNIYFQGEYSAEGRLSFFNNGQNPNGIWLLIITDLQEGTLGKLEDVRILFSDNPATIKKSPCTIENSGECHTTHSEGKLLPDLAISRKLAVENIRYFDENHSQYPNQLRFAAAMTNLGDGPLHIITTNNWYCREEIVTENTICKDGTRPTNNVQQVIYQKGHGGKMVFDTLKSGVMFFDDSPGHNHYHVKNWANFKLLKKKWWTKDYKCWEEIAASEKVSYCLFDNKICTNENEYCKSENSEVYSESNLLNYGLGTYSSCNSKIQGISVGGIDYYGMYYEGQSIDLPSDIVRGTYYLLIEVDPSNEYLEKDETNNSIVIPVEIE